MIIVVWIFLSVFISALFIEGWPRIYPCGQAFTSSKRWQYLLVLPIVGISAWLFWQRTAVYDWSAPVNYGWLNVALLFMLGVSSGLDIVYRNISLPLQVLLLILGIIVTDPFSRWLGLTVAGAYFAVAKVKGLRVGYVLISGTVVLLTRARPALLFLVVIFIVIMVN